MVDILQSVSCKKVHLVLLPLSLIFKRLRKGKKLREQLASTVVPSSPKVLVYTRSSRHTLDVAMMSEFP